MTNIDLNRVKGNFGSSYVSYKLSKFCLVRQVTEGTDIGIDLYCESFTDDSKPFLHFWVQVKTGESIKISSDNFYAKYPFSIEHLLYWYRQPVPVFVFLVPIDWPQENEDINVFVINITDYMLKNKIPKNKKFVTIKSNRILLREDDYRQFIKKDVPYITAAQSISIGSIRKIPAFNPEYVYSIPTGYSVKYIENILWQLRTTTGIALRDLFNTKSKLDNKSYYRNILTKILEAYTEDKHWEVHYSLGLAYLMNNDFSKAKKSFQYSLKNIEDDPNINQNDWSLIKRMLRKNILDCDKKIKA